MGKIGLTRRNVLKMAGLGTGSFLIPSILHPCHAKPSKSRNKVRFGICADVHKDVIHDADKRLKVFIDTMNKEKVDFIVQLGDFCRPYPANLGFMEIWKRFAGPGYHVLGNHDTDGGFTRQQTLKFWGTKNKYYSFDICGFHFIVLDGNDINKETRSQGYPRFIGAEQLDWLKADLEKTGNFTILFSHQSLENDHSIENNAEVRAVLEKANKAAGFGKVIASFSGHHHIDFVKTINSIHYIQINSMSYKWVGEKYRHARFSPEIEKAHPWVSYTVPYKDPLFAIVTLTTDGILNIDGTKSQYIPPTPSELGYPAVPPDTLENENDAVRISDRELSFATAK
ncbi:MAG: metallophosphoesterase family protein [Planctomycetota bacterium]|jgi:predicted phosphodiesterase